MLLAAVVVLATLLLAWGNGANDNFKGVATLWGGGVLGFRASLAWATVTTLAGSLVSILLAERLVKTFSGAAILEGGTPDAVVLAAMLLAAAATILLATWASMPTSTTHALMGALLGAVGATNPASLRLDRLGTLFLGPMLVSPLIAVVAAMLLFPLVRGMARWTSGLAPVCVCTTPAGVPAAVSPGAALALHLTTTAGIGLRAGSQEACEAAAHTKVVSFTPAWVITGAHALSAGAVCFARALNDTPKIAAVLLTTSAVPALGAAGAFGLVTAAVVLGGVVQSRGVARTMSRDVVTMDGRSGLTANVVTAGLVLWASRLGLPVSTTHVSCASIFGIGAATRRARAGTIGRILATWVGTFPLAAVLGFMLLWALRAVLQGT